MTIFKSIAHSQSLLQQLSSNKQLDGNPEILDLLTSLTTELENINSLAQQLSKELPENQEAPNAKPEIKSGCYVFADEKGFFCPSCYDNHSNKVATTRINSKLRICPACRTSIK
ncbi:MAG: hypothetical protein GQ548_06090 [Methylophaga sp.]|nr:hypothetical protein [Methylophaga sp.]